MAPNIFTWAVAGPLSLGWISLSYPLNTFSTMIGLRQKPQIIECPSDMRCKTVIVTGANCGVGYRTAAWIAKMGGTVILACRSKEKGEAAQQVLMEELAVGEERFPHSGEGRVLFRELDLGDLHSVQSFAEKVLLEFKDIDVLINNAGVNDGGRTKQGLDEVFGVNFIGHFLLTSLLLERLKQNKNGARIVNLASVVHRFAPDDCDFEASALGRDKIHNYQNSKLAMVLFTRELERRLAATKVRVFAVNPGAVRSEIWRTWHGVSKQVLNAAMAMLFLSPDEGSATSVHVATQPLEKLENYYYSPYYAPEWMPLAFEMLGPFAGAQSTAPNLPKNEKSKSLELWILCENIISESLNEK
mmetsp:Transcript_40986/g.52812  ORF Transcript_40986/g.52812 Transcript_40986/m.52812 type:complete len:358 (-) Transcript_40986:197-1270(-)